MSTERGPEGRELDSRYRLTPFDGADAAMARGLVELWTSAGALPADAARERVAEAAYVATAEDDGIVGVSTVRLANHGHLGLPMWSYRTFVAPAHREGDIAFLLLHRTRDLLLQRRRSGVDTRAAGMVMEVQNEILKRARNQAVWKTTRFTFIGEDETGAHHRVFFFPGASAPVPGEATSSDAGGGAEGMSGSVLGAGELGGDRGAEAAGFASDREEGEEIVSAIVSAQERSRASAWRARGRSRSSGLAVSGSTGGCWAQAPRKGPSSPTLASASSPRGSRRSATVPSGSRR